MSIETIALSGPRRERKAESGSRRMGITPQSPHVFKHAQGADATTFTGAGFPDASTTVSFGGNPILMHGNVALLFYGSAWENPNLSPSAGAVIGAIQTVFATNYFSGLADYQCTGASNADTWNFIVTDDPPNPFDPDDAGDAAEDVFDNYYSSLPVVPNFFAFFLPPGVMATIPGVNGAHSIDGDHAFSWQLFGSLPFITSTFTHELVEAITDPDGDGWQVDPRNDSSWNEIADICKNSTALVNGVSVAAYFSTGFGACVVPQPDPPPPPPPRLPDGEHEITCADFDYHNGRAFIGAIGGTVAGQQWAMNTSTAIDRIDQGELTFFTMSDGHRADVLTGVSRTNNRYLTTSHDGIAPNNLDAIAATNRCDSGQLWL